MGMGSYARGPVCFQDKLQLCMGSWLSAGEPAFQRKRAWIS